VTRLQIGLIIAAILVIGLLVWLGLLWGKPRHEETPAIPPPPPPGAASSDEVTTGLGQGKGLEESLAPTSVKWTRVFVLDAKRAVIAGDVVNETIALFTDDAGTSWKSFRTERDAWSNWSVGLDGTLVVGTGSRDGAPTPQTARAEAAKVAFGAIDGDELTVGSPLFPPPKGQVKGLLQIASAIPAVLGQGSTALVVEEAPRKLVLLYGGKPGAEAVPPVKLPSGEKVVPVPYGRAPVMLSFKGRDLLQRPFPAPGKPLDKPVKVTGVPSSPKLLEELSAPPLCETGAWSFQRVTVGKRAQVIGVSPKKIVSFALPDSVVPATNLGCGADKVVVEAVQAKTGAPATWADQPDIPILLTCDLAGKCSMPKKNAPFRIRPGPQKREIVSAATTGGTLGVMTWTAGARWGLYLGQTTDGVNFERQRPIGEGTGDRGRIELGALLSFGKRALLLISADVTGTSRRGWFVMVSDDGGTSWNPP